VIKSEYPTRVLRWLGLKTIVIVMIVAVLTCSAFVINWIRANRCKLEQVKALEQQVVEKTAKLTDQKAMAAAKNNELNELRRREPHWLWHPLKHGKWKFEYEFKRKAYDSAIREADELETELRDMKDILDTL
jgi:biopolymer transport protein ExbB/TolQ